MELAEVVLHLRADRCDLSAVDRLARLVLEARRLGCTVEVAHVVDDLADLLDLVGISVEVLGEPEHREQPRFDEGVLGDDPTV